MYTTQKHMKTDSSGNAYGVIVSIEPAVSATNTGFFSFM